MPLAINQAFVNIVITALRQVIDFLCLAASRSLIRFMYHVHVVTIS